MNMARLLCLVFFLFEINVLCAEPPDNQKLMSLEEAEKIFSRKRTIEDLNNVLPVYEAWAKRFPESYDANWKLARVYCQLGNSISVNKNPKWHKKYGKLAMRYAEKAVEINPNGKDGLIYYIWGIGEYSMGVSIITAFFVGLVGKFHKTVKKLREVDEKYMYRAAFIALARYYSVAPWPVKDVEKAHRYYENALEEKPILLRFWAYLAEHYMDKKDKDKCMAVLNEALELKQNYIAEYDADYWHESLKKIKERKCEKNLEDIEKEEEKDEHKKGDKIEDEIEEPVND